MNPILYVILNGELNMSPGKAAAQAAHAAMMLKNSHKSEFTGNYERSVIALAAKNTQQLLNLAEYLRRAGIGFEYYIDEGRNEVDAFSVTALAVAPIDGNDETKRRIFESFPLFGSDENEKDDEYDDGDYCESENDAMRRTVFEISRQLGQLSVNIANMQRPPFKPVKRKWYQRFRRGFVS